MLEKDNVKFRLVPENEFSQKHLEEYPVWSEFYDYDEREEIISWGIDPAWLDEELAKHHNGNVHAIYPLLQVNPFPDRMRIYIRARFRTSAGQRLSGYIVNEDACPAVAIFHEGQEFGFNYLMFDWAQKDIKALQQLLPDYDDPIFPLEYETDFTDEEGRRIRGEFNFVEE